jgi:hypothetical protein
MKLNIPNSIEELTEEKPSDALHVTNVSSPFDITKIISDLKVCLPPALLPSFLEGIAFYKQSHNYISLIKNILLLTNEVVHKNIEKSSISLDEKKLYKTTHSDMIYGIISILESYYNLLNTLNQNKNIIDIQEISCNILGYAIENIKKSKN